ncbi:MAG TPA: hypothetical protein VHW09_05955 [Bryobacteraceae bacterium]|jgi:hypothetical protein|nr:hypothetical protein [Bryobacteraceae bacterium]
MNLPEPNIRKELLGVAILSLVFVGFYWIAGDILQISGDEGIYLEGGRRIAMGQQPYRDFFVLTGPLTFWIQGLLGYLSGIKLVIMRLPVILDAAFLVWAVYWFTSRYTSIVYATGAALAFAAYECRIRLLAVNHRWDSGALATAAIVAALWAQRSRHRKIWILSGILAAAAAWATPSMAIVGLPLLYWSARKHAGGAIAFLGGTALTSAAAGVYLQWHHALLPMVQSLRWTAANYTAPNLLPYGNVWAGAPVEIAGWQYVAATAILAVPAILPPVAIAGWLWFRSASKKSQESPEILPMVGAAAAMTLAAWPRWGAETLFHTMAFSWFLCALLLYRLTTPHQRFWCGGVILVIAGASLLPKLAAPLSYPTWETRVGTLDDPNNEGEILDRLERRVNPGDSLFSFPYLPSAYYYLDARNPSRYTFMQPGMMAPEDERQAIDELRADPPRWVIYERFPAEAVFRIWPGTDPARIPMAAMNQYLADHYREVDTVFHGLVRLKLMERVPAP